MLPWRLGFEYLWTSTLARYLQMVFVESLIKNRCTMVKWSESKALAPSHPCFQASVNKSAGLAPGNSVK